MNNFNLALTESKTLRNEKIKEISDDKAIETLSKAKALIMATWQGKSVATTKQMAEFFEISEDTVQTAIKNHRDEFQSDGLFVLKGKALKDVVSLLDTTSKSPSLTIWTPRAALRLGMLLRDSEVAKQVRNVILDLVEQVIPAQNDRIRELELEIQLAQAQAQKAIADQKVIETRHTIVATCPEPIAQRILGYEVIRETERVPVVVNHQTGEEFDGVGITYIAKSLGFKTNKECWNWLESVGYGKSSGKWKQELTAVQSEKISRDDFQYLKDILPRSLNRQMWIGEVFG